LRYIRYITTTTTLWGICTQIASLENEVVTKTLLLETAAGPRHELFVRVRSCSTKTITNNPKRQKDISVIRDRVYGKNDDPSDGSVVVVVMVVVVVGQNLV
jgi:hypothetical protein